MQDIVKKLLVATVLLFSAAACSAEAGRGYKELVPAQPTNAAKIEVLEFFFYECSHCNTLHPHLAAWKKNMPGDVQFTYVPTIFRSSTEPLARTYYVLEGMGKAEQMNDAIYRAIHVEDTDLRDLDAISAFVARHGVDREKFAAAYNSFAVQSKVMRAKQMIRSYGINGTPTLVVDGKYVITGLHPDEAIRALNEAVAQARKDRGKR